MSAEHYIGPASQTPGLIQGEPCGLHRATLGSNVMRWTEPRGLLEFNVIFDEARVVVSKVWGFAISFFCLRALVALLLCLHASDFSQGHPRP